MTTEGTPIVLLTGSNSGIGRAAVQRLAARDVRLILHARTSDKAGRTRDELAAGGEGAALETAAADLESPDEIQRLCAALAERHGHLDVLINNAGVAGGDPHTWTVNVLAPFRLAHGLRPLLAAAPGGARVLNVASAAQTPFDLDELPDERGAEGPASYGKSKLALIMLSIEMARRWRGDGIAVNALHPGTLLDTRMVREHFGTPRGPVEDGGSVLEYLALSPDLDGVTGAYFDQMTRTSPDPLAEDGTARRRLWAITARMAGVPGE